MLKYILLNIIWVPLLTLGQYNTQAVLDSIAKNNKTILANQQYWIAQNKLFETGLTPYDPTVEFEYLLGTPSEMGDQIDFTVAQPFDFPTVYKKKKKLANAQKQQAEFAKKLIEQDVLFEAQTLCINLVYQNKLKTKLIKWKESANEWVQFYQKKIDIGDGTILDLNKAKLHLIDIETQENENNTVIKTLQAQIIQLNGGKLIACDFSDYDTLEILPDLETLKAEIEAINYEHKLFEQQKTIAQKQTEVTKALSLPKLELAYRYQSILNQQFNGIVFGVSLPLWENKNKVAAQKQFEVLANDELDKIHEEHTSKIEQLYNQYQHKKTILNQYTTLLESVNSIVLLDKALKYGEISVLQYFQEVSFYFESTKKLFQIEKEYQEIVAALTKFRL